MFLVDATIGTDELPAIAVQEHIQFVESVPDGAPFNQDYLRFQKQSLDTQVVASCILNAGCLLINPSYSVCLLISSTIGTIYLYLLEKQVESWGTHPLLSLVSYQTRMLLLNSFIIYSFMEYNESRDLNYLIVSAFGFFLYRFTLLLSVK